jgi:FO synthase/2-phospho-L-lactate guanylyltransferase
MSIWSIIPVKPLNRAKSRLAGVLSAEQRSQFAEVMLRRILEVVNEAPEITGTLIISRDTKALSIARDMGAKTIQESSASDLNPALNRATEIVRIWGAAGVLILPADLPFVTTEDITSVVDMGMADSDPTLVIATDKEYDGTNALFVRPPGLITYSYGYGSYDRHIKAASQTGAIIKHYNSENLRLDIDVPADLERYNERVQSGEYDMLPTFLPNMA